MAKQSKKKQSPSQKAAYAAYYAEGRHRKNKIKKLERHIARNTDENMICSDAKAVEALKRLNSGEVKYIRNNNNKSGICSHAQYMYREKPSKKGGRIVIADVRMPSKHMRALNRKFKAAANADIYASKKRSTPTFTCWGDELRHIKAEM